MILDTSVLIEIDRGISKEKLSELNDKGPHKISSVTKSEFYTGVFLRDEREQDKAQMILSRPKEIPFRDQVAKKSGELIARKKKEDLSLGINDIYIAATAIVEGEKVLTADPNDFNEIEELEVEDW